MFEILKTELENYARINAIEAKERVKNHGADYSMVTLEFIDQLSIYWKSWNAEHFDYVYNLICNEPVEYSNFIRLMDEALEVFKYTLYGE